MTRTSGQRSRIRAVRLLIEEGAGRYDRRRHAERLLGADDATPRQTAIARLRRALRAERQRGRAGHWAYDLNRHIGLLQALKSELARLERLEGRHQPTAADRTSPDPATEPCISATGIRQS